VDAALSAGNFTEASIENNLVRVARLRQSILTWAFEGKLVDQDPNDEPASVLLERIRQQRAAAVGRPPKRGGRVGKTRG
jgi:type I restriction enzyme S subunit